MRHRAPLIAALALLLLAGCTRSDMDSQPKYNEYKEGALFGDGQVLQAAPPGTVAREDAARTQDADNKPAVTADLLARGQDMFNTFCSPCHDRTGGGDGMVVQRGMPRPPSFHEQRLRAADDAHFYDVMSNGYGAMYSYAARIHPRDRWAIVAYLRALQLSQHAQLADLPADERARLTAETKP
jgi:mono/diheme cytochrome c family protein